MYELYNGTNRLIQALELAAENPEKLGELAEALYYCEDGLAEDIRALSDYHREAEKLRARIGK